MRGRSQRGERRYPGNVRRWVNIAAEDDYISHDQTVENDFAEMVELKLTQIEDVRMFNLAVRGGTSNPHHSCGYLISPELADVSHG